MGTEGTPPDAVIDSLVGGLGDLELELNKEDLADGEYVLRILVLYSENSSYDWSYLSAAELSEKLNDSSTKEDRYGIATKDLEIDLHTSESSSLFGSGETHRLSLIHI